MIKPISFLLLPLLVLGACGTSSDGVNSGPEGVSLGPVSGGASTGSLREASGYAILAKSGISNVPTSAITGNIGVSPIDAQAMNAFAFTMVPATGDTEYATSSQITGRAYAADFVANDTAGKLTEAVASMEAAYSDAAGRINPDYTELHAGLLGGKTLSAGLYKWSTDVSIDGTGRADNLTLRGNSNDVWIFQISGDLKLAAGREITLVGGAQAKNIFWQVGGPSGVTVLAGAHLKGIVMSATGITLVTGALLSGRALAQTLVALDHNIVTEP